MSAKDPLFAFFGTSVDSTYALEQLERVGLVPALVVDTKEFPEELYNSDWDFFLVASYGKILPKKILDLPKHGCLNIHPSLLPKYRGPSPYVSAMLDDERQTGVSIIKLEEKMDAGPILAQARIEIASEDWPPKGLLLSEMLFTEGVNLLAEVLPDYLSGKLVPAEQDETLATYTKKFGDADALIDLGKPREAFLKIQAFDKSPRAHFINEKGKRVVVTEAAWKDGALEILKVLPEGKKEMSYADYVRGVR
ncbi:MAG TPA: methionyl-tRNA formyltransferase [Candidatus Paceibacterota bacterium]|jgi:methionyl-tRNA formyltransferase|nr:methionyl-tRNA formyltransferase [Candidatus Paceibacterota bacterium]